jgi:molecular chaperone DnaK (HSP70)
VTPYIVGIDLGTSNTVVAFAAAGSDTIQLLPLDQLVGPGEVAARPLLPSVRYHPAPGELNPADLQLPWPTSGEGGGNRDGRPVVIGSFARDLGAQVPGRLVASAKSWLSHAGVDRSAPILPWGAGEDVAKVSPVAASASYLAHVRSVWNARFPDAPLEQQDIVLTVPAAFDEGARALTLEAARLAQLPTLRLLEEPQAAFHDWLFRHRLRLGEELAQSRLVLVCDVGGGTTDLTLIQVESGTDGAAPKLTRIGVGDHLMLGGDNMDLALTHLTEKRLATGDSRLSSARLSQLTERCRVAKERLLAANAPDHVAVTLLGAGAKLIGGARSADITREEVERLILDGFFPIEGAEQRPQRRRVGIVEFGLPYPADPAITRHLAAFLHRHADAARAALGSLAPSEGELPLPDTILLNGGVFRAPAIAERLVGILGQWRGAGLRLLHNEEPDVAVARGAVAHALVRAAQVPGAGPWIGGGSARSYFLVLDEGGLDRRGICVLPRGTEEGQEIPLPNHNFALRLGQAVRFHLVSSVGDTPYRPGEMIDLGGEGFVRLPPIASLLPSTQGSRRVDVTVQLTASMTEVGTLEMHCVSTEDISRRWLLAFQLRAEAGPEAEDRSARLLPRLVEAIEIIDRAFGPQSKQVDPKAVRQLRPQLERLLGKREEWDMPLLRALFDALWERARRRRRSAEHERVWLNLAGYCLRPGQGAPLDEWRIEQVWGLFEQGIQYVKESRNWSEWWTLWRRAAGGLGEVAQLRVLEILAGHLETTDTRKRSQPSGPAQATYDDMVSLAASLERVPVKYRIEVGDWLFERLARPAEKAHTWWAVGRVGARELMYGSAHNVVPADTAAQWLEAILALDWQTIEPAAFAAAQIARMTGDRSRDLPPELQKKVVKRLEAIKAPQTWVKMVCEPLTLDEADQRRSFGESLPPGLKLIGG